MTDTELCDMLKQKLTIAAVIGEAIKLAGPDGIPSGHLYAATMSKCSLDEYQAAIRTLTRLKLVREWNHLLVWIGGAS